MKSDEFIHASRRPSRTGQALRLRLQPPNILVALAWPPQQHHAVARSWFAERSAYGWATCALTQNGFLRTMLNPALRTSLTATAIIPRLETSTLHPCHRFRTSNVGVASMLRPFSKFLSGHKQISDCYLIALAVQHSGVLLTLDHRAATLAASAGLAQFVELIKV